MKSHICQSILAASFFFISANAAVGLEMPAELANIRMGMSTEELLGIRPAIRKEGIMGAPINFKAQRFALYEDLPKGGLFSQAIYTLDGGKIISAMITGNPPKGEESKVRRRVVQESVQRWGKKFQKRAPKDQLRENEARPVMTWIDGEWEVVLLLPKARKETGPRLNAVSIQVRTLAAAKDAPWVDMPMKDAEKKAFFEANDVSDAKP